MSNEIAVKYMVDDEEVKLTPSIVSEYLANGAQITLPEFKMFTSLCKARGLNPFLKEAYIIKFGNSPAQIIVGKDAILKRAILNPNFDGREQGIIVINKDGEALEKPGTFLLDSETLAGGWAKVYRKDWSYPVYVTVAFSEVAQKKRDGNLNSNWATKSATMVEKIALVRALREAFVENTGGMYEAEELAPHESVIESEVIVQDDPLEEKSEEKSEDDSIIDINSL